MRLQRVRQAVVLAGGYGRRMLPLTAVQPKPMIPVAGRPFLEHMIEWLKDYGIERVTILAGWKAERISSHFGDGKAFGVAIDYSVAHPDVETAQRLKLSRPLLNGEFLMLYGDNFCPVDLASAERQWLKSRLPAQVTIYDNSDNYSKSNVSWHESTLTHYDPTRNQPGLHGVEIGLTFLRRNLIELLPDENSAIGALLFPRLATLRQAGVFTTRHRYYGPSKPDRLAEAERFFEGQPTVILDQGLLQYEPPTAGPLQHLDWRPGALEALATFHRSGWRILAAAKQPAIGVGATTMQELAATHVQMRTQVSNAGGAIEDFLVCPHADNSSCGCWNSNGNLLFLAQRQWALDLPRTIWVSFDPASHEAALAGECPFAILGPGDFLPDVARLLIGLRGTNSSAMQRPFGSLSWATPRKDTQWLRVS